MKSYVFRIVMVVEELIDEGRPIPPSVTVLDQPIVAVTV